MGNCLRMRRALFFDRGPLVFVLFFDSSLRYYRFHERPLRAFLRSTHFMILAVEGLIIHT